MNVCQPFGRDVVSVDIETHQTHVLYSQCEIDARVNMWKGPAQAFSPNRRPSGKAIIITHMCNTNAMQKETSPAPWCVASVCGDNNS